jgi:cell division protein FtsI (penicillin-binding protein 3)
VIGRVNIDNKGQSGIEITYDSILGGKKGKRLNLIDAKKRQYRYEILKNPQPGKDLYLTIDETIQYYASRELKNAVLKARAKWGTIIVSNPESGEILAMANYPDFNLNHPPSQLSLTDRIKAIHPGFDPGSTFKIILASAALESKKVSLNDKFDCSKGFRWISGKTIRDHHRYGILTFPEVIIHSSNVGATLISDKVGEKTFYNMIKAYGFGSKTGIDLWAEEKGTFHPLDKWETISPASLSIGYEISVTAIQMLQAVNVLANRGVIIPFRIAKNIPKKFESNPSEHKRVLSSQTATILTDILTKAATEGTGKEANITGYTVAGKTGTAQKLNLKTGRYSSNSHTALFVGFVPAAKPVISMIVVIDDPQGKYYGGEIAAPVFREVGAYTLQYLQVPQETTASQPLITARLGRQD